MKRHTFLAVTAVTACLILVTAAPSSAGAATGRIETVVRSGEYRIIAGTDDHRIVMEGFDRRGKPGAPMLPTRNVLIALPPGARFERIEADGLGETTLSGRYRIVPAPPILPLDGFNRGRERATTIQREWKETNESAYSSDAVYPNTPARFILSGSLRKYSYVSVSVCPFAYRALSGELRHYDAVRVTVHYSVPSPGDPRSREIEALMHDRTVDTRAAELFVNFDAVRGLYEAGDRPAMMQGESYNYVIITADALVDAIIASDFPAWKNHLGYSLKIVTVTDTEIAGRPGVDLAEQIRNFLRSRYGAWGIQYVLIVGDIETVPMRYSFPNPDDHTHDPGHYGYEGGSVPSDNYYADLSLPDDLSWDLDGDGYHGEYLQDNPDFLAEVYVGRIPTSDGTRITYTLDKLVDFEQDTGSWKNRALLPGSILFFENQNYEGYPKIDGCTLLNEIQNNLMGGWTVSRYSEQTGLVVSDFPWPAVDAATWTADWSTGQYGVVNWSGHGACWAVCRTVWQWDDGDGVPETYVEGEFAQPMLIDPGCLLDDDYPSVVFAVSCYVGYPEANPYGNLGIDLLTEPGSGAAAGIVCSTRPAWISADVIANPGGAESICYEFNRYGITENERLGDALYHAKHYCYQNYGWDHYGEHINQCNFNLYGDPSMLRTGATVTAVDDGGPPRAAQCVLHQNLPNPFNPSTSIRYELPRAMHVTLRIYNVTGELVTILVDDRQTAGRKEVTWNGRGSDDKAVASGVYFYSLTAGGVARTRKMVLLR